MNSTAWPLASPPLPEFSLKFLKWLWLFYGSGIRLVIYLDDILILNESKEGLLADIDIDLLQSLGFLINWEKSIIVPTQTIEYLGLIVDSTDPSFSLQDCKAAAVKKMCALALSEDRVKLRTLASIQRNFSWAIPAIPFAQSHYRSLQRFYISNVQRVGFNLESKVRLSPNARLDLSWWVENIEKANGKMFFPREPDFEIFSDASLTGWGAVCNGITARGPWTLQDKDKHINELELLGAFFVIQAFAAKQAGMAIRIFLDNSTAVSYVNKCGGTRSVALTATAKAISTWCEERKISLEAVHLAGELNTIVDRESRSEADASDWRLDVNTFRLVANIWRMDTDLFAASWNSQLHRFISWGPQPGAIAANAFSVSWKDVQGYAFPPFSLIFRCIDKLRREKASIVLICPICTGQPWFPVLLEQACDIPRLLRPSPVLLTSAQGESHPFLQSGALILTAWKLSGDRMTCRDFRDRLLNFSWRDAVAIQMLHTNPPGSIGEIGVWSGIAIPCVAI